MRVITFSRQFPVSHPKKGEPTFFPESIINGLGLHVEYIQRQKFDWMSDFALSLNDPKFHTIRAGNRWKVGDWFSPRVWSGKPYASKQIQFASDIQIKKIWEFEFINSTYNGEFGHDKGRWFLIDNIVISDYERGLLAKNDGLDEDDFIDWFKCHPKKKETFKGQILCWNENINYLTNE